MIKLIPTETHLCDKCNSKITILGVYGHVCLACGTEQCKDCSRTGMFYNDENLWPASIFEPREMADHFDPCKAFFCGDCHTRFAEGAKEEGHEVAQVYVDLRALWDDHCVTVRKFRSELKPLHERLVSLLAVWNERTLFGETKSPKA